MTFPPETSRAHIPIFLVGCPRSGTTLLRDMLSMHPGISIPRESHVLPRLYRAYGDPGNAFEARRLAGVLLSLEFIRLWAPKLDPDSFGDCRSFREVVSRVYGAWARNAGKSRWGDKTPQYVAEIPTLREIFPESRFIHIYRDGRDVALSWIDAPFGPNNVYVAASDWRHFVTEGRRAGRSLPPGTYLEVRYESLLEEPEATLRRICEFLEEEFHPQMLKPERMQGNWRPLYFDRSLATRAKSSVVVSDNKRKWGAQMSPADRARFESLAGDLLRELDYEIEGCSRPIGWPERIAWSVHHQTWEFLHRLNRRDKSSWMLAGLRLTWADQHARWRNRVPGSRVDE